MSIIHRISNLFRRSELDREIDSELASHIEMRTADNIAQGMSPEDARRDALIRFGNPLVTRERVTAADAEMTLDSIWRDLHYSARQLRRSPAFTMTAVLTLALGIGANVIVFSIFNALILRPLDVPQPDRLYNVVQGPKGFESQSYPDYLDYKQRNTTFSEMAAYRFLDAGLGTGGVAYKCWFYEVSGSYFDMLEVRPILGRFFHSSDEHGPNSAPYIVLAESFWRSRFNADPNIVGAEVEVNKHPFTVLGVAPASFHGTDLFLWPDFFVPLVDEPQVEGFDLLTRRTAHGIWVLGRLKPGVTPEQATDNLNSVAGQLAKENPAADDGMKARLVKPGLMGDLYRDPTRAFLLGIMALALLVLLAACTNLAGIFAARAADRGRELAIRLAIGSSRWCVLRQLLIEAVMVSLLGGIVGTSLSAGLLGALTRWQPLVEFPAHVNVVPYARVYGIALLLSIGSGLLFGLLPSRQIWRTNAAQAIKSGTTGTIFFRRFALRDLLLAIQIALCTLLVTSALVALRGMQRSLHAPMGFQPQGLMLAETDMHMAGHADKEALSLQKRMLEEAAKIPGVSAIGIINDRILGAGSSSSVVWRQGTVDFRSSTSVVAPNYFSISPGYLHAAETRLLAGRDFTWNDDEHSPKVAIVNQIFARSMFDSASAIGMHFMTGKDESYEIVGIVEDGKYESLTEDPQPAMFFPLAQDMESDTALVVRSQLPTAEIASALHRMLAQIDPNLPFMIHSYPEALASVLFPARVASASLGIMGLLAAMLAVTGIFGMAAYSVSKRMRELGVRVALGARPAQLMRSALGRPLMLLLAGSAAGLLLGVIASKLLAQIVYQATPRDPLVLAGVMSTMALLGLLAIWIPARHALAIDPAGLLREE